MIPALKKVTLPLEEYELLQRHYRAGAETRTYLERMTKTDSLLLMCGEMTAAERRVAKALAEGMHKHVELLYGDGERQ